MLIKCKENEHFLTSSKLSLWLSNFFFSSQVVFFGDFPKWKFQIVVILNLCFHQQMEFIEADQVWSHKLFIYFVNSFIEVKLTYTKLYIFKQYNLLSFDMCIQSWHHHRHQNNEHIRHPQRFACAPCNLSLPHLSSPRPRNHWPAVFHYELVHIF